MKQAIHLLLCGTLFIAFSQGEEKKEGELMPYSKEYNEEKYIEIEKYISQLGELEEGKVLTITTSSVEEAERLRWLFYDYFHLTNIRGSYKLALFNNLLLVGGKKRDLSDMTSLAEGKGISKRLDSLIQTLIASPTPRRVLEDLVKDETISYTALGIVLGELGRVLGE